jgi:5'-phosphate synthase pdxT subunit
MRIGVLALQGDFAVHRAALARLGHDAVAIRRPQALGDLHGLILPGGESSAILKQWAGWDDELAAWHAAGRPTLGTCAGLILMARSVEPAQQCLGWLDVSVRRNAYGRQRASFEAHTDNGMEMMCIRAPRITRAGGVEVLDTHRGEPVLVRQGNVWGCTFHPELTGDIGLIARVFSCGATGGTLPSMRAAAGTGGLP